MPPRKPAAGRHQPAPENFLSPGQIAAVQAGRREFLRGALAAAAGGALPALAQPAGDSAILELPEHTTLSNLLLTVLTATGITAAAVAWPPSFDLIRYAGAAYLLWLAYKAMRPPSGTGGAVEKQASLTGVFARAALNSLLNPKALLFFMVFLPQFADPAKGQLSQQFEAQHQGHRSEEDDPRHPPYPLCQSRMVACGELGGGRRQQQQGHRREHGRRDVEQGGPEPDLAADAEPVGAERHIARHREQRTQGHIAGHTRESVTEQLRSFLMDD